MKKRFLIVALIGLMLVGGLVLIGCDSGCSGNGDCVVNHQGSQNGCLDKNCAAHPSNPNYPNNFDFAPPVGTKCDC